MIKDPRRNAANFDVPLPYRILERMRRLVFLTEMKLCIPSVSFDVLATCQQLHVKFMKTHEVLCHHRKAVLSNDWSFIRLFINERQEGDSIKTLEPNHNTSVMFTSSNAALLAFISQTFALKFPLFKSCRTTKNGGKRLGYAVLVSASSTQHSVQLGNLTYTNKLLVNNIHIL